MDQLLCEETLTHAYHNTIGLKRKRFAEFQTRMSVRVMERLLDTTYKMLGISSSLTALLGEDVIRWSWTFAASRLRWLHLHCLLTSSQK